MSGLCILALGLSLAACSGKPTIYDGEDAVRARLRDPSSAEFSDVTSYTSGENGGVVVCGHVNSRNGMGGMTGDQRFVAGGKTVLEEEVGPEVMDGVWANLCH